MFSILSGRVILTQVCLSRFCLENIFNDGVVKWFAFSQAIDFEFALLSVVSEYDFVLKST